MLAHHGVGDGIWLERKANSGIRFSEWHKANMFLEPLIDVIPVNADISVRILPLSKLPQVIAVLRLNGIEVELGEGL